jgi:propanol-preferring alcohol dehydrogenase
MMVCDDDDYRYTYSLLSLIAQSRKLLSLFFIRSIIDIPVFLKMSTMEAVRYNGANKPLTLELIPKPTPSSDQILVKVEAAALCHTELHFADGTLDLGVKPMTLGHEAVGTIVEVGDSVPSSRIGERVIVYYYVGCGKCRWCRKGEEQICNSLQAEYGFISDGGLADYLVAPSRNAVVLPDTLSFVDAAPIGCGVTTAVHAAKLAEVKEGEYALVYGCNGVGFGLIQLLKNELRVEKVIIVARSEAKRAKALELGADVAIDGTDPSTVAAAVREATNGEGADVIFECVGRRETMDACVGWAGALGRRGRLVMVGYHAGDEHEFRYHPVPMIVYEQNILGSVGATLEDLKQAVDLVGTGKIKTVVDCTLPLSRFQEGLDKIKSCDCIGKIVCLPCTE